MKTSSLVIIGGIALTGTAAIYLWRSRLHDEAVALTIAAEQQQNSPDSQSGSPAATLAAEPAVPANPGLVPQNAVKPAEAAQKEEERFGFADKDELKKMRTFLDAHLKRIYEDVGTKLGLNAEEQEKLVSLISDQQFSLFEGMQDKTQNEEAAQRAFTEWQKTRAAAITAQLGPERNPQFQEYERSVGARYEVEDIRLELERVEQPMTETQRRDMIEVAIDRGAFAPYPKFQGNSMDASMQEIAAQTELRDQRMREVARGVLTQEQFGSYENFVNRRHDTMEHSMRNEDQRKRDTQ